MAEQYNEVTNRLVSTRNADNPEVNHIVTGSDAVYDDNYPLPINGYVECDTTPISNPIGNPHEQGWCEEEVVEGEGTGKYILTEDVTVEVEKSYYKPIGARQDAINNQLRTSVSDLSGIALHANEYNEATIHEDDNPQANGWYELSGTTYVLTTDNTVVSGKTYYIRVAKITSNEDKIIGKEDGYVPTAGAVGRAMGANFEDNLQSTSIVKGLTANMGRVLNENKADINGYYETMSVGSAKNLDGENTNSEAYLIRPTGGESNEVANGVASVLGMEGNSCVWNQIFPKSLVRSTTTQNGITFTNNNDGSLTITGTATADTNVTITNWPYLSTLISGHKYFLVFPKTGSLNVWFSVGGTIYYESGRYPYNGAETGKYIVFHANNGSSVNLKVYQQYIDITAIGIDNLTLSQVKAWLAEHVGTKPYYAYNPGTILSANTLGFKTYGQNLLNPTTKQAKLIPYTHTTNSNKYTVKGIPTGAAVTYTPDNTGVAVDVTSAITDNTFDISSYGIGTLYIPNATANTYVCMKYDGAMDDEVVPYKENTYNFDVRNIYGKNNGVEYQCFPNGMKSANNVYDTLSASEAVVKVGGVDLGTLSWAYNGTFFYANIPSNMITVNYTTALLCSAYVLDITAEHYTTSGYDKIIGANLYALSSTKRIFIKDTSHTSAPTTQNNWLSGVMLNYFLKEPITYTDLIYRDGGIDRPLREVLVNLNVDKWSMEEQLMTDYDEQGNPTSVTATIKTKYSIDAVEAIKALEEITYTETEVRTIFGNLLTCLNGEFSEELGGTFVIKDNVPPTPKVFDFEFVENASTNSTEENTETI